MTGLTDEDRAHARRVAAAMPPWTDEQLAELARLAESVPTNAPRETRRAS